MCFSATASFIAGVSLSVLGAATVKMAKRKAEIPFAMIPLLFGAQQIVEGMLWLSFRFDAPLLNVSMTYLFTLFSHVPVSYTHLRAHETDSYLVCRLLLEKKKTIIHMFRIGIKKFIIYNNLIICI